MTYILANPGKRRLTPMSSQLRSVDDSIPFDPSAATRDDLVDASEEPTVPAEAPKVATSHKGRSYARCCYAVTTVAAVTVAVAGTAFQLYGKEIMGAYTNMMNHTS